MKAANKLPALSTVQMVEVDRLMIEEWQILLIQMMENAGRNLAHLARARFLDGGPRGKKVVLLAGTGGNGGGDGADHHFSPILGVLDGVFQEVQEHVFECSVVGLDPHLGIDLDAQGKLLVANPPLEGIGCATQQGRCRFAKTSPKGMSSNLFRWSLFT